MQTSATPNGIFGGWIATDPPGVHSHHIRGQTQEGYCGSEPGVVSIFGSMFDDTDFMSNIQKP